MSADFMITVTDRSAAEEFAAWFRDKGAPLVLTARGRGTASTDVLDYLGLEATEKAVLFCTTTQGRRLVHQAEKELWLDVPGRGIVMTVPLSSIGGRVAKEYLLGADAQGEEEKEMTHELIVVITEQGYTDHVMDAARAAGATGGTTVHAKGTGTEQARKFFGVSIAEEKDMVFILARKETRNDIMKAIIEKAGMKTEARSLVFSLPVSDLAGLRKLEEE